MWYVLGYKTKHSKTIAYTPADKLIFTFKPITRKYQKRIVLIRVIMNIYLPNN